MTDGEMTDRTNQDDHSIAPPDAASILEQQAPADARFSDPAAGPGRPVISVEDLQALLPPENLELLSAVLEISQAPTTDRTRLYHALMAGSYLVPVVKLPSAPEDGQPGEEVNVDVVTFAATDGTMALPAFTHAAALQLWTKEDQPTITLQGRALFQLSAPTAIAAIFINPAGPFGGQVSHPEIEALAQGVIPIGPPAQTLPAGPPNVYIDLPLAPIPAATSARVQEILESNAAVVTAHLFLMQVGEAQPPILTLGVHAEGAAAQWVIPQLTRALRRESLSFEPYQTPQLYSLDNEPGAEQIRKTVPAFYTRAGAELAEYDEMIEIPASAESEEVTESAEATGYEEANESEEATETGDEDETNDVLPPRRRQLWPFGRRG